MPFSLLFGISSVLMLLFPFEAYSYVQGFFSKTASTPAALDSRCGAHFHAPTALFLHRKNEAENCKLGNLPRRHVLNSAISSSIYAALFGGSFNAVALETPTTNSSSSITLPLEYIPKLGAYVVHFYLFGEQFGAVLDTGSPFLTVPFRCNKFAYKYRWGCYRPELTLDSGYSNTVEGFDNNQGTVVWRRAGFSFFGGNETTTSQQSIRPHTKNLVFGVLGEALMDGSGGVFFGLIKETDKWIRPSFMGQMGYTSFCVDLRRNDDHTRTPQLTLSQKPLLGNSGDDGVAQDYIPLVRDLNRRYKAPVVHYSAKPSNFVVNGLPLKLDIKRQPTYVIFDTGVTGMAVSQELFDGRYLQARKNKEKSLWGQVTVEFQTQQGNTVQLSATKPVTTPLGKETPFRGFKGNLVVLGLAFLDGRAMTIDIEDNKVQFHEND